MSNVYKYYLTIMTEHPVNYEDLSILHIKTVTSQIIYLYIIVIALIVLFSYIDNIMDNFIHTFVIIALLILCRSRNGHEPCVLFPVKNVCIGKTSTLYIIYIMFSKTKLIKQKDRP